MGFLELPLDLFEVIFRLVVQESLSDALRLRRVSKALKPTIDELLFDTPRYVPIVWKLWDSTFPFYDQHTCKTHWLQQPDWTKWPTDNPKSMLIDAQIKAQMQHQYTPSRDIKIISLHAIQGPMLQSPPSIAAHFLLGLLWMMGKRGRLATAIWYAVESIKKPMSHDCREALAICDAVLARAKYDTIIQVLMEDWRAPEETTEDEITIEPTHRLSAAIIAGESPQTIKRMIRTGAVDINNDFYLFHQPLLLAWMWGRDEILHLLLDEGADVAMLAEYTFEYRLHSCIVTAPVFEDLDPRQVLRRERVSNQRILPDEFYTLRECPGLAVLVQYACRQGDEELARRLRGSQDRTGIPREEDAWYSRLCQPYKHPHLDVVDDNPETVETMAVLPTSYFFYNVDWPTEWYETIQDLVFKHFVTAGVHGHWDWCKTFPKIPQTVLEMAARIGNIGILRAAAPTDFSRLKPFSFKKSDLVHLPIKEWTLKPYTCDGPSDWLFGNYTYSILHYAYDNTLKSRTEAIEVLELCLEKGVSPNETNPVMYRAIARGDMDAVKLLLRYGATEPERKEQPNGKAVAFRKWALKLGKDGIAGYITEATQPSEKKTGRSWLQLVARKGEKKERIGPTSMERASDECLPGTRDRKRRGTFGLVSEELPNGAIL